MTNKQKAVKKKKTYCLVFLKKTNNDQNQVLMKNKIGVQKSKFTVWDS